MTGKIMTEIINDLLEMDERFVISTWTKNNDEGKLSLIIEFEERQN